MGWPAYREGRYAGTSRPGRLAFPRRGSMRQPLVLPTEDASTAGVPGGYSRVRTGRSFRGRINEEVGGYRWCGRRDAVNGGRRL